MVMMVIMWMVANVDGDHENDDTLDTVSITDDDNDELDVTFEESLLALADDTQELHIDVIIILSSCSSSSSLSHHRPHHYHHHYNHHIPLHMILHYPHHHHPSQQPGSTLPLVMIVSEGDTIRLKVKFEPQDEETFVFSSIWSSLRYDATFLIQHSFHSNQCHCVARVLLNC